MTNHKVIKGGLRVNPRRRRRDPELHFGPSGQPQVPVARLARSAGRKGRQIEPTTNDERIAHYEAQNGRALQLTPRQAKRVRKHLNRDLADQAAADGGRLLGAPMTPDETIGLARKLGARPGDLL